MTFDQVVKQIYQKSPLQKKKLQGYLTHQSSSFFKEADEFISHYAEYLMSENISFDYAIDAYLKMCKDMLKCQVYFMKYDKYPMDNQDQAYEEVYNSKKEMRSYMVALALSQYLWRSHYEMFNHLKETLRQNKDKIKSYLEIGPGHGLFFKEAINTFGNDCKYTAIDISKTSLDLTKSITSFFKLNNNDIIYINDNMLTLNNNNKYDLIVMGEVLEHVEEPGIILNKLNKLLHKEGRAFISTCVNCPTIDHVYHFKSVNEIQNMIRGSKFNIISENILPVEKLPMDEIIKEKITINYSAIIEKDTI
jgi:ubiquinone/menaquinone biosynthesis C-methylase UbiE